jgi:hypothetical protein
VTLVLQKEKRKKLKERYKRHLRHIRIILQKDRNGKNSNANEEEISVILNNLFISLKLISSVILQRIIYNTAVRLGHVV